MTRQKLIKTHSISEFIQKNQKRKNVRWSMSDGHLSFLHDEHWWPEEFFDSFYPIYIYEKYNPKGELIGTNYLL